MFSATAGDHSKEKPMRSIVLTVASFVLVAMGFLVGLGFSPQSSFSTSSSAADTATSNYDLNASNTDNVYQQIVVAGWGTRDMLEVIANQTDGLDVIAEQLVMAQETQVRLQVIQLILTGLLIASVLFVFAALKASTQVSETRMPIPPSEGQCRCFMREVDIERVEEHDEWVCLKCGKEISR
jgi:hypothetical protein